MRRVVICALAFVAAGCVQKDAPATTKAAYSTPSTTIRIKGSEAMKTLGGRLAAAYQHANRGVAVKVDGGGTTAGFIALADGSADIAAASRPISEEERAAAEAHGAKVSEMTVAYDAVALYVNNANRANELTPQQVANIVSGTTKMWSEVGGPNAPIVVYGEKDKNEFTSSLTQPAVTARPQRDFADTRGTIAAVAAEPNAIGYAGLIPTAQARLVWINKRGVSVAPSERTVGDQSYPISGRFYFCTLSNARPEVKKFADWVRSPGAKRTFEDAGAIQSR